MKKIISFISFYCVAMSISSQIIIQHHHMPQANQTYIVYEKQMLFLSPTQYENDGPNQTWNFSNLSSSAFFEEEFISALSFQINPACVLIFNNFFDPVYLSNLAQRLPDFSDPFDSIRVENVYAMYKVNQQGYIQTGRSATVNGILPFCPKIIPPDTIYKFPLQYGQSRTSSSKYSFSIPGAFYYEQSWTRTMQVDAWGTISTPADTFQSLRVKMDIQSKDSIFYDSLNLGLSFPSFKTLYIWLSNTQNYPVFIIERTPLSYLTPKVYWLHNVITSSDYTFIDHDQYFYVVPSDGLSTYLVHCNHPDCSFILFNQFGQIISNGKSDSNEILNLSTFSDGIYFLKHLSSGKVIRILKLK